MRKSVRRLGAAFSALAMSVSVLVVPGSAAALEIATPITVIDFNQDGRLTQADIAAATAAAGHGDTVSFPGGVYDVESAFAFAAGVNYVAEDPDDPPVLRHTATAADPNILTVTADATFTDATIRGLWFDNVRLVLHGSARVTLADCRFGNEQPRFPDPDDPLDNTRWDTPYLQLSSTTRVTVEGCVMLRDSDHGGRGIDLFRTTESVITGNHIGTTPDLEPDVRYGYFKTAINVHGGLVGNPDEWDLDDNPGGLGSRSVYVDGNVWRRSPAAPPCAGEGVCAEDHGLYAWGVQDLTVRDNVGDGWSNTSAGGALKVRNSRGVFVLGNHFQTSGIKMYTHFCAGPNVPGPAADTCYHQQVQALTDVRVDGNRVDLADAGTGAEGIFYRRVIDTNGGITTGPVCTGSGVENAYVLGNVFPRGGVVNVACAYGPALCAAGNAGGGGLVVNAATVTGVVATTGCVVPDTWDQPLTGVHRGDFNGDGRDDFAYHVRTGAVFTWRLHLSSGDGYAYDDWNEDANVATDTERYGVLVADFNGDGKDDLAYHGLCGTPSAPCWRVLASTGTGFAAARNWYTDTTVISADTFAYGFHVGDFDADGRADIAFRASCGADQHACWTVLASQPGDVFAARDFGDGMWVDPVLTATYGVLVGDFDGDHRTDLAYPGRCGTGVSCLRVQSSTGSSFAALNWITNPFYFDDTPVNVSAHFGMRTVDRNGDGLADVASWGRCGAPGVPQWRYLMSTTAGATVSCSTTGP